MLYTSGVINFPANVFVDDSKEKNETKRNGACWTRNAYFLSYFSREFFFVLFIYEKFYFIEDSEYLLPKRREIFFFG